MGLSNFQLAAVLVFICALSGVLAQDPVAVGSYCRLNLWYNTDSACSSTQGVAVVYAEDNACTTHSEGGATISVFTNCTSEEFTLYGGNQCSGSNAWSFVPGACVNVSADTWIQGTFGGSSSTLTSWISLLSALFF